MCRMNDWMSFWFCSHSAGVGGLAPPFCMPALGALIDPLLLCIAVYVRYAFAGKFCQIDGGADDASKYGCFTMAASGIRVDACFGSRFFTIILTASPCVPVIRICCSSCGRMDLPTRSSVRIVLGFNVTESAAILTVTHSKGKMPKINDVSLIVSHHADTAQLFGYQNSIVPALVVCCTSNVCINSEIRRRKNRVKLTMKASGFRWVIYRFHFITDVTHFLFKFVVDCRSWELFFESHVRNARQCQWNFLLFNRHSWKFYLMVNGESLNHDAHTRNVRTSNICHMLPNQFAFAFNSLSQVNSNSGCDEIRPHKNKHRNWNKSFIFISHRLGVVLSASFLRTF